LRIRERVAHFAFLRKIELKTYVYLTKRSGLMLDLTELFVTVDDLCKDFRKYWESDPTPVLSSGNPNARPRKRKGKMSESEIVTILIQFHRSSFRCFKHYYLRHVMVLWAKEFPTLVSYSRFVRISQRVGFQLLYCLQHFKGQCTGLAFVDAMAISVCHNKRIPSHRVFDGFAKRGKTTMGFFYGFKLHLVINEKGELLAFCITPGNVDDRTHVDSMTKDMVGKLYGDKGYISKELFEALFVRGLELITKVKKNMKNRLISEFDKCMLRKRALIESVNDQLQNISMIEHTRHRSLNGFLINVLCALIAYCLQPKKPSLARQVFKGTQDLIVI
jgi:hypothetical protein